MPERALLIDHARRRLPSGFGGALCVEPDGQPAFVIDGTGQTTRIIDPAPPGFAPDLRWIANTETLLRIFEGSRAVESAYLSGRLVIAGDMAVMARLEMEPAP